MTRPVGRLRVLPVEYQRALELSRAADTPAHESAEYWQLCRYYREQMCIQAEAESALDRIRGISRAPSSVECPHCHWGIAPSAIEQHIREKH